MSNAIFPCPFCGRRMGVNRNLLGRHVRCPHCKQVIQAPAVEGGSAVTGSAKLSMAPPQLAPPEPVVAKAPEPVPEQPPAPAPEKPVEPAVQAFTKPQRETHESILGDPEESEDEVFASRAPTPTIPQPQPQMPLPDLSAFVPRLPVTSAPVIVSPIPAAPTAPTEGVAGVPTNPEPKPTAFVDVTGLPTALPRPQFQAPPASAKGTMGAVWATPQSAPQRVIQPAPTSPIPGAPAPPEFLPPAPPPLPTAQTPAGAPANPWAAFDVSGTHTPLAPQPIPAPAPPPFLQAPAAPVPPPFLQAPIPAEPATAPTPASFAPTEPFIPAPGPAIDSIPQTEPAASSSAGFSREEPTPLRGTARPAKSGGSGIGTVLLGLYALAATAAAVYAFFFHTPTIETRLGTDLSTIPDRIGEYPPAERKKVGNLTMPLDGPLPDHLKVALHKTIQVGQLEITPLSVEEKAVKGFQKIGAGEFSPITLGYDPRTRTTKPGLVLTLRLKNTSTDVTFHPADPALNRRDQQDGTTPAPGTGLVLGTDKFWGGPSRWPFHADDAKNPVAYEYFEGQEGDQQPLAPGEERVTTIIASRDPRLLTKLQKYSGPITWRVHLRCGLETTNGKDEPVTAVIGVEFEPKDIQVKS